MTLQVTTISIVISTLIGMVGGPLAISRYRLAGAIVRVYVEAIRNTPILVQMFFIFYGLPEFGVHLSIFWSGVFCLSLWGGAYQIENVRGGLQSLAVGHWEAARALGLSTVVFFVLIALPLALRVALPSMLNTVITLFKNSAYLQAIGLAELTFVAVDRVAMDFRAVEMFAALLVIYLSITLSLGAAGRFLEHRFNRPFRRS